MICPCCATHFGLDDAYYTVDELRTRWISNGAIWFSKYTVAPPYWSAISQLRANGYDCTDSDLIAIMKDNYKNNSAVLFMPIRNERPVATNSKFESKTISYALAV
jgi:hypothetical protein